MFRLIVLIASLELCASIIECPSGGEIYELGISDEGKAIVQAAHNKYRQMALDGKIPYQPQASSMNMLTYDNVLGNKGRIISETCKMNHIKIKDDRWVGDLGQNIGKTGSTILVEGQDWQSVIDGWYNEHQYYTYPYYEDSSGHYSQVIWADTTHVGCDFISFHNPYDEFPYQRMYTCNYGASGNYPGIPPYPIYG